MCDKCDELDVKIERYRRLVDRAMDPLTRNAAAELIDDLNDQKTQLHPAQEK